MTLEQLNPLADMRSSDNWAQLILAVPVRSAPQLKGVLVSEAGAEECVCDIDLDGDGVAETMQAVGVDYQYLVVDRGGTGQNCTVLQLNSANNRSSRAARNERIEGWRLGRPFRDLRAYLKSYIKEAFVEK